MEKEGLDYDAPKMKSAAEQNRCQEKSRLAKVRGMDREKSEIPRKIVQSTGKKDVWNNAYTYPKSKIASVFRIPLENSLFHRLSYHHSLCLPLDYQKIIQGQTEGEIGLLSLWPSRSGEGMQDVRYTLVIPCHNEARRLRLRAFRAFLASRPGASLLFVDDGSDDGTAEQLEAFDVLRLERNLGKAEAVRAGVLHCLANASPPDYIGFWDADLATPLSEVGRLLDVLEGNPDLTLALGSRWVRLGGQIRRAPLRAVGGRLAAILARWATGMPTHDTQCGAKLFRTSAARTLFGAPFALRWLFDVELLLRLPGGAAQAEEVPLKRWNEVTGSQLTPWAALCSLLGLARLAWYTHRQQAEENAQ